VAPLMNYTTSVDVFKTVNEIQQLLVRHKARNISMDYGTSGELEAICFAIERDGTLLYFRLPSNCQGVHKALVIAGVQPRYRTMQHANKVAWRIVKDWVEAQIAVIESGQASVEQAYFSYLLNPATGQTMFESFCDRGHLTLGGTDGA